MLGNEQGFKNFPFMLSLLYAKGIDGLANIVPGICVKF